MRDGVALDVLHDDEELVFFCDDVERRHDVRMTDHRGEARLVEEHRDELGVLRVCVVESLDRDGAREARRPEQAPEVDSRHATGRDAVVHDVPTDEAALGGRLLAHRGPRKIVPHGDDAAEKAVGRV